MPSNIVFHPVGLTPIQLELIALLQLLYQDSPINIISEQLLSSLLHISNHPYLLVPHYMPKKLLLMEPHVRFKEESDKFVHFDSLLTLLISLNMDKNSKGKHEGPLNVAIVGNSIKELDLIEAFILGWGEVVYKRYTGSSLVDDYNHLIDQSINLINEDSKIDKDSDDYIRKRTTKVNDAKKKKECECVILHLVTVSQLKLPILMRSSYEYVISFNQMLSHSDLPSVQDYNIFAIVLATLKLPTVDVLKTTTDESFLHDSKNIDGNTDKFDSPGTDLACLTEKLSMALSSKSTKDWPFKRIPALEIITPESMLALLNETPNSNKHKDKRIKLEALTSEFKDYQTELTKLVQSKITEINSETTTSLLPQINTLRVQMTMKHNQLDQVKLNIAHNARELNNLKDTVVTGTEKKFGRLESEYEKYQTLKRELEIQIKDLKQYQTELSKDPEQVLKHSNLVSELADFHEKLTSKNTAISIEIDTLRSSYQTTTSEAVSLSSELSQLSEELKSLDAKLQGKGRELRKLQTELQHLSKIEEKQKISKELELLKEYNSKLESMIKEKATAMGANGNGSNGNVSNGNSLTGRSGRLYRSSTPYV